MADLKRRGDGCIKNQIECEKDWQEYLEKELESFGWKVKREVTPSGNNNRADFLIHHSRIGNEWIGIEAKHYTERQCPYNASSMGAVDQILEKYRYERWPNKEVRLWAVAPFFQSSYSPGEKVSESRYAEKVLAKVYNQFGIGYLFNHGEWASISFKHSVDYDKYNGPNGVPVYPIRQEPSSFSMEYARLGSLADDVELLNPGGPVTKPPAWEQRKNDG